MTVAITEPKERADDSGQLGIIRPGRWTRELLD